MSPPLIRVLVVDDSAFMRGVLPPKIEADPRFDGKVPSGTYVLRWRADDGAWRSKKIDLAENAEYKLTVGAGAVELMQVGRGN